jgi:hypothetical protein
MKIGLKIGVIESHPQELVMVGCARAVDRNSVGSWQQLQAAVMTGLCRRVETPAQLAEVLRTGEKSRFLTGLCKLSREFIPGGG